MLLLESSVEAAHKIYIDNIKRLDRTNEKLRHTVRRHERESRDVRQRLMKKEDLLKAKERIVDGLEKKLHQKNKEKNDVTKKPASIKNLDKEGNSKSQSRKKKEKSKITEIPILVEDQEDADKEKSRDIFFYDILKYWNEEDIIKELSKIGKVCRIQIKKQYKYTSVKAKITLFEQFDRSFNGGAFGMGINKHFIRWYDGESTVKDRKERDKYQLIRDLSTEEMEECKNNEYNFLKKIRGENTIAAIKVLKIGKVWKILIYLANEQIMEKVFKRALERGVEWSFQQFKRPFQEKAERNGITKNKSLIT
jgi:hypothetical protein